MSDEGTEEVHTLPTGVRIEVTDGQTVAAGDSLTAGPLDPKELMEIKGVRATQTYLVDEIQKVYRQQGVQIHDKHIELIVRQMTRRVGVQEPGDSDFLPGERVDQRVFRDVNQRLLSEGKRPAEGRPELMGITKASLATDSWLSAASFQETTRVLTEAAIDGRGDTLVGLKENIIIGKLIPAGTGMLQYREFDTVAPEYEPMAFWSSDAEADPAAWLASLEGPAEGDAARSSSCPDPDAEGVACSRPGGPSPRARPAPVPRQVAARRRAAVRWFVAPRRTCAPRRPPLPPTPAPRISRYRVPTIQQLVRKGRETKATKTRPRP